MRVLEGGAVNLLLDVLQLQACRSSKLVDLVEEFLPVTSGFTISTTVSKMMSVVAGIRVRNLN